MVRRGLTGFEAAHRHGICGSPENAAKYGFMKGPEGKWIPSPSHEQLNGLVSSDCIFSEWEKCPRYGRPKPIELMEASSCLRHFS